MKEWFTAAELAEMELPGLPATERGVRKAAIRDGWDCRQREGRGGGREFSLLALPEEARLALSQRALAEVKPTAAPATPSEEATAKQPLKAWQKRIQEARGLLLGEVKRQALLRGKGITEAEQYLETLAAKGELPEPLAVAAEVANNRRGNRRGLKARSLAEWRRTFEKGGFVALAPAPASKKRTAPPAWLPAVLEVYRRPSKPTIKQCYERLQMERPDIALPSLRAVQREIQGLGAIAKNRGRMGPRELKTLRAYTVRDFSKLEPMDVVTSDGHTHDQEVQHPIHGRAFRPELITVLDVATRRALGWSANLAEGSFVVADSLRMTTQIAGIAGIYYVDNGCGFRNELLDEAALGVLARMGTSKEHSLPYNSQARGVIERFNATCWVRAARELPSYVGRDMDREARQIVYKTSRREIETTGRSRFLMPWDDFIQWAQQQVDAYNNRPHSSLPKIVDPETGRRRHQTPNEAWATWVDAGWEPVTVSEAELEDFFRPYAIRKVSRGQVTLGSKTYFSRSLDIGDWHGEEVMVGYDIHDPTRVWVRDLDERLICVAELDANKVDYFPQSAIEEARERRAKAREKRLQLRLDEVKAERGGNVIEIMAPVRTEHDEAAKAELQAEIRHLAAPRRDERAEKRARVERALDIEARLEADQPVSERDREWFERYRDHPEFQTQKEMIAEFGRMVI